MSTPFRQFSLFVLFVASLLVASDVAAEETLVETGATEVSIGGLGRGQLVVQDADDTVDTVGLKLLAARLNARAVQHQLGEVFFQLDATNDVPVLDLIVDINFGSPVGLKLGKFKTPVSREFLMPLGKLPTIDRARLTSLAPRRAAGLDLYADFDLDGWWLRADTGLYNPTGSSLGLAQSGMLAAERLDIGFDFGLSVHVAYAQHVLGDNEDLLTGAPLVRYDRLVDAALVFERAGLRTLVEGVYAADGPGATEPLGAYALVAYLFGSADGGGEFGYEPAVGADWVDYDEGSVFRSITATFNWLINGRKLQASLGYSAEQTSDEDLGHVAALQFQGTF